MHLLFFCHFITVLSSCQTCTTDTESHPCLQQSTRGRLLQPPREALMLLCCWGVLHRFHLHSWQERSICQQQRLLCPAGCGTGEGSGTATRIFPFSAEKKSIYCSPLCWDTITASQPGDRHRHIQGTDTLCSDHRQTARGQTHVL